MQCGKAHQDTVANVLGRAALGRHDQMSERRVMRKTGGVAPGQGVQQGACRIAGKPTALLLFRNRKVNHRGLASEKDPVSWSEHDASPRAQHTRRTVENGFQHSAFPATEFPFTPRRKNRGQRLPKVLGEKLVEIDVRPTETEGEETTHGRLPGPHRTDQTERRASRGAGPHRHGRARRAPPVTRSDSVPPGASLSTSSSGSVPSSRTR